MRQAVMVSPGSLEIRDVPAPVAGRGELLVRMKRIGVCGSDIHVWHGKHTLTHYPVVQGHEVSGVVEELGPGVRGFRRGDPVTIQPQVTCGTCFPCTHGSYHICDTLKVMGFQTMGAASELFAVDAAKVLKLPSGMSLEHGAMVEPVAVGVHALGRAGSVAGLNILVLGAGPIGNLVAQAARGLGAARVMITDVSDYRLDKARECGIPLRVNVAHEDLGAAIIGQFGTGKADLILECVGSDRTIAQAIEVARKGTDIIVVGVFGDRPTVDMGTVQDRELRLTGTLMYREPDWRKAIELISRGIVRLAPLVTDRFPVARYPDAYRYIDANRERAMKVMISFDE
ncbi:MAG: alcohol dehydrogenase [Spirochaetes bacterium RBG_13_68_11]|nr:MAG: alcohol dehydrogenase [Spirochaetes bacterium RBG_13_68_11]